VSLDGTMAAFDFWDSREAFRAFGAPLVQIT
jgi:hypothetical protein